MMTMIALHQQTCAIFDAHKVPIGISLM